MPFSGPPGYHCGFVTTDCGPSIASMHIFRNPPQAQSCALLAGADLPTVDLKPHHFRDFFACGPIERPTGIVGLEIFGPVALLRSLAVAGEGRGQGAGKALVAAAEELARENDVMEIFLLTTTAEVFFSRLGYARTGRVRAPESIKSSREFADLCPDSAAFMSKRLTG